MAFVYLAHAPEDGVFASRLSSDLQQAGIENWYDNGEISDEVAFTKLRQATHFVAVLSHDALANERFLGALEYARENRLQRLALRLTQIETLPPQLTGILPLDFTNEENYAVGLDTLMEDLQLEPPLQLPDDIMTRLESEIALERKAGIEALLQYQDKNDPLHQLALEELRAVSFRERDDALRKVAHAAVQAFLIEERPPQAEAKIPSKEELELQAATQSQPLIVGKAGIQPKPKVIYLWQTNRWYAVLFGTALLVGGMAAVVSGEWAYLIPMMLAGLVLPWFNIWVRENGSLSWEWPKPLVGNGAVGVVLAGLAALFLSLLLDLESVFLLVNAILGLAYGVFTGWLSSVKLETV